MQTINVLRWIAVVAGAVACGLLTRTLMISTYRHFGMDDPVLLAPAGIVSVFAACYVGAWIAPSRKARTGAVLAIVVGVAHAPEAWTMAVALLRSGTVEWPVFAEAAGRLAGSLFVLGAVRRGAFPSG
ncbi:MAG: hypothetical protein OXH52_16210 [Gammaproteobacteria bacterium]|nr:hypothetical protein [Gammaproteobacteria bacterium]